MQEIDFYLVDAFSDRAFGGNAAAVCPLEEWLPDETLLKMAQQHNQSETAFFVRTDDGFELRWFTTLHEINLCGHATLAASHVIFEYLDYPHTEIHFTTRFVGELTVKRSGDWLTIIPRQRCSARWASQRRKRYAPDETISWCWRASSRWRRSRRISRQWFRWGKWSA